MVSASFKKYSLSILFTAIIIVGTFHRIYLLGFSDFQQDEVGAQNYLFDSQSFVSFLMSRSIGPGQFVITYLTNLFAFHSGHAEFLVRLPFALAGIGVVVLAYLIAKKQESQLSALITVVLFSFSGYLIAFSRLAQYQSFAILIMLLCVYTLLCYFEKMSRKVLLLLGFLCGLGGLFHYDMATFIIPFAVFIWLKYGKKGFAIFVAPLVVVLAAFYVPYIHAPTFGATFNYLYAQRIANSFDFDGIYHSLVMFRNYHSREYLLFIVLGFLVWLFSGFKQKWFSALVLLTLCLRVYFVHPVLVLKYFSIVLFAIYAVLRVTQKKKVAGPNYVLFLELWFMFSFLTYGLTVSKPMTHVYAFLLPLMFLIGDNLANMAKKSAYLNYLLYCLVAVVVISSISFNYQAFNSFSPNYPWEDKSYIFGKMIYNRELQTTVNESVGFGFGFLYHRDWNGIDKYLSDAVVAKNVGAFASNEKERTVKYYLRRFEDKHRPNVAYVFIKNPYDIKNATDGFVGKNLVVETETFRIYVD